jgi:hypothetical protein
VRRFRQSISCGPSNTLEGSSSPGIGPRFAKNEESVARSSSAATPGNQIDSRLVGGGNGLTTGIVPAEPDPRLATDGKFFYPAYKTPGQRADSAVKATIGSSTARATGDGANVSREAARRRAVMGPWVLRTMREPYRAATARVLAAHEYDSNGSSRDRQGQLRDSLDTPGGPWTELWAPVGLRYHALHHYFPGIPYHNLGTAYRRIVQSAPHGALYRESTSPGLWQSLKKLYRRARQRAATFAASW